MLLQATPAPSAAPVRTVVAEFLDGIVAALPRLLSGLVFLVLAYVTIRVVRLVLRSFLARVYPSDQTLVVDLLVTVATLFLWFGAGLALLNIVGMGEIAASLGTATGFIALGVAFALKEMIADTVAGVYLLRDPDFNEGDLVTTASVTGTIVTIDLRKTRIRTDEGDLVVVANRDVEKRWTQETVEGQEPVAGTGSE
ncbi:MAG: mechanosensitive ion channel family protein [Haloferacaceae archaeon]